MNRAPIFLDSSFYVATILASDRHHARATELERLVPDERIVTTEAIFLEVLNFFSRFGRYIRTLAANSVQEALDTPTIAVEPVPTGLVRDAVRFYLDRPGKDYSLTDCISMLICKRLGIREVATSDHGFEQEGFTILLKGP